MRLRSCLPLVMALCLAARADGLPDLGDSSQRILSPQQEREIGREAMSEIRADHSYLDDPEISDYLNGLGLKLVAANPSATQDFEFFVLRDSTLNAFALPGGYIGVHTGLLTAAQSESELAGVLAHEIAHVTQHHLARVLEGQSRNSLATLAALAVAILAARSNSQVSQAAVTAAQATAIQTQLDFTREHEQEADRIGLQTLTKTGFDPRAMASFFERLQKFTRVYDSNAPSYLRTHPVTSDRIADIQNRLERTPYRQVSDSLDFQLVRTKVHALQDAPKESVRYFEGVAGERKSLGEAAYHYGYAVALRRAQDLRRAEQELSLARELGGNHPMIENLAAGLKRDAGNLEPALDLYRSALKRSPDQRALNYGYVETLLLAKRAPEALDYVNDRLVLVQSDYRWYELRARSYAAMGKRLLQHQSQAEAYVRQGNYSAAIDQLQIAVRSGDGDFYQLSSAEARLKELRATRPPEKKPPPKNPNLLAPGT